MEIRDLKAFAEVVEAGSMTRAAARLHLVQSAVSQAVQRLEREVQVPLLIRRSGKGGVRPTEAGSSLARHAEYILTSVARARHEMDEYRGIMRGTADVGIISTATPLLLARLLKRLRQSHPGLRVNVHEASGPALLDQLRLGRLDVAVLFLTATTEELATFRMFDVELGVIVPLDHPLASRQRLRLRDLRGENWISFPAEHPGRRWLDESFAKIGQRPHVEAEVETLAQLKALVEAGLGLSILPLGAVSAEVLAGQIRAMRLTPTRRVAVGYVADPDHQSHAVMAVRLALETLKQQD